MDANILRDSTDDQSTAPAPRQQDRLCFFVGLYRHPVRRVSILAKRRLTRCPWKLEQAGEYLHYASVCPLARG